MYLLLITYENWEGKSWNWWDIFTLEDARRNLEARRKAVENDDEVKIIKAVILKVQVVKE